MATPTTILPSATLAALDGGAAHASAVKPHFRDTVWSGTPVLVEA
jgi:hypothetical protein